MLADLRSASQQAAVLARGNEAAGAARRLAASPWPAVLVRGDEAAGAARRLAASPWPAVLARGPSPRNPRGTHTGPRFSFRLWRRRTLPWFGLRVRRTLESR